MQKRRVTKRDQRYFTSVPLLSKIGCVHRVRAPPEAVRVAKNLVERVKEAFSKGLLCKTAAPVNVILCPVSGLLICLVKCLRG